MTAPTTHARPLAVGIMALPLIAMGLVAVVMPPALAYSLLTRGIAESQAGWVVFGGLTGAMWLAGSAFMVRRARKNTKRTRA